MKMKIISWNVNGIRAINRKGALASLLQDQKPDIVCLQEIRCSDATAKKELTAGTLSADYPHVYINVSKGKKGYAGTAILSKIPAADVVYDLALLGNSDDEDKDKEGRMITARFDVDKNSSLTVVCVYVPNSQEELKRLPYRIDAWEVSQRAYYAKLAKAQRTNNMLLVCGDLNVAHQAIDIHNPSKRNQAHAGFTDQERTAFGQLLSEANLIDTFRTLHPTDIKYSWWSNFGKARANNKGWRIDYILASAHMMKKHILQEADILTHVSGSDHAPVSVTVNVPTTPRS